MSHVPPVPPANPPAGDQSLSAVLGAVTKLVEQQQSLMELLRSPSGASRPAAPPVDDLRSLVKGIVQEHQAAATKSAARDAYMRKNVADLPEAYRRMLPETDDAAALSAAEQSIRRQFREDLKSVLRSPGEGPAAGEAGTGRSVGSQVTGGAPPAAAVDFSKLSPMQQIAVGLRQKPAERIIPAAKKDPDAGQDLPTDDSAAFDSHDALFVGAD